MFVRNRNMELWLVILILRYLPRYLVFHVEEAQFAGYYLIEAYRPKR